MSRVLPAQQRARSHTAPAPALVHTAPALALVATPLLPVVPAPAGLAAVPTAPPPPALPMTTVASGMLGAVAAPLLPELSQVEPSGRVVRVVDTDCDDLVQIRKDLPRTFPDQPAVQARKMVIEAMLAEHAVFDPELGYCQGMSFVAAVVAAQLADSAAASLFFRRLVDGLRGLWLPGFPLLVAGMAACEALQRRWLPDLHEHLQGHGATYDMFLPEAWLTLFSRWLPFSALYSVFVFIEAEGLAGLLCLTVVLLEAHEAALLGADDFTSLFVLLKSLGRQPQQPDVGRLFLAAKKMMPEVAGALPSITREANASGSMGDFLVADGCQDRDSVPSSPSVCSVGTVGGSRFIRKGSRVLHANSDVEAVLGEDSDVALERHAHRARTASSRSPQGTRGASSGGLGGAVFKEMISATHERSEKSSLSSLPSNRSRFWLLSSCAWCAQDERSPATELTEWA